MYFFEASNRSGKMGCLRLAKSPLTQKVLVRRLLSPMLFQSKLRGKSTEFRTLKALPHAAPYRHSSRKAMKPVRRVLSPLVTEAFRMVFTARKWFLDLFRLVLINRTT